MGFFQQCFTSGAGAWKGTQERDDEDVTSGLDIVHLVRYSINIEGLGEMNPQSKGRSIWAPLVSLSDWRCPFPGSAVEQGS